MIDNTIHLSHILMILCLLDLSIIDKGILSLHIGCCIFLNNYGNYFFISYTFQGTIGRNWE